ncbi:MAG: arsenite methyltransferase [Chloroflexi bacterium]|nr:arsenite methyltransferase [Chloroflexota bacterium]
MKKEEIRKVVRESYGKIALQGATSCCSISSRRCGCSSTQDTVSKAIGYSDEELSAVPEGANLGLGCGNSTALASLKEGEVVLDLGSGAGFDCFLAAVKVGESGRVIGVDMTAEMIEKARENARKGGYRNVEFRLGEIGNLPVADNSVDVVISNCVINLSPDKKRVLEESYRVLKPGGSVMVSDIALLKELPSEIKSSIGAYVDCVAGATTREEYLATVEAAGFQEVEVVNEISAERIYSSSIEKALTENLGTSSGMIEKTAGSTISMQIRALKLNQGTK